MDTQPTYGGEWIDFTTRRLGSRWRGHVIAKCPKCGRKGAYTQERLNARNFDSYYHKVEVAGFTFVRDYCSIPVQEATP